MTRHRCKERTEVLFGCKLFADQVKRQSAGRSCMVKVGFPKALGALKVQCKVIPQAKHRSWGILNRSNTIVCCSLVLVLVGLGVYVFCGERGGSKSQSRRHSAWQRDFWRQSTLSPSRTHERRATSKGSPKACCVTKQEPGHFECLVI